MVESESIKNEESRIKNQESRSEFYISAESSANNLYISLKTLSKSHI